MRRSVCSKRSACRVGGASAHAGRCSGSGSCRRGSASAGTCGPRRARLLMTTIPLRLLATWSGALFAIGAGGLLKQRLLYGALRLEPEEVRHEGVGHLLGRVFEGEAVETLALGGGLL